MILSTVRKLAPEKAPCFPLLAKLLEKGSALLPAEQKPTTEAPVAKPPGSDVPKAGVPIATDSWVVGQEVILSVKKNKEQLDGRKCKILAVLTSKLKLELLEGPCKTETRTFPFASVRPVVPKAAPVAQTPPDSKAETVSERANDALAEKLFGSSDLPN